MPIVLAAYAHNPTWPRLPAGAKTDRVVVEKARRSLTHMLQEAILKSYRVRLGRDPVGAKVRQGDGRTPEGRYTIDSRNPRSRFHLALHVSYPDAGDRTRAAAAGLSPGGDIMIHGLPNGLGWLGRLHQLMDWTDGCIALTNPETDEIWRAIPDGTPIEIKP
ncbi:MAG TPA: L,D-transpeptidase family protein [Candidatus Methylomirabilis sp.]|nr:L,D-transpeptidase family protein [Candidatus Methylomirabilis sp.]